jgi:apolipoprotein N-acyltransferase
MPGRPTTATSSPDPRGLACGLAAVLATALLVWFGTGLSPLWPLTWFAPLPVLLFALRAHWWAAALASAAGLVLGLFNLWSLLHGQLHVPWTALLPGYLAAGAAYALAVLLFRALARRAAYWSALVAFPAACVSFEWLQNLTSPHGTGGSLAYSQLRFLPFLQLASLTGPWGMTFLLCALPAALALAIHLRLSAPARARTLLLGTVAVLAAVLLFGVIRLLLPVNDASVRVGLVAADGPHEDVADAGRPALELVRAYAPSVTQLARQGAAVVVLPEKIVAAVEPGTRELDAQLQQLADQAHVALVVGVLRIVPQAVTAAARPARYNEARIYAPAAPVAQYDKEHMLPPFESNLTPGSTLTLLPRTGADPWGVAICKDMDFTGLSRQYGAAGAGLMLVPAWDFFLDWLQHGHMAIMRGVESGFSVVRSAKGGSLYASDDRGRIIGELKSDAVPFSSLLVSVPQRHDGTLFLVLGDGFAWLAVALLGLCLLRLLRGTSPARRPRSRHS